MYTSSLMVLLALSTVLDSSMATVMGPTPPGTGVIHDALSLAAPNSTSPTRRLPDFLLASTKSPVN